MEKESKRPSASLITTKTKRIQTKPYRKDSLVNLISIESHNKQEIRITDEVVTTHSTSKQKFS